MSHVKWFFLSHMSSLLSHMLKVIACFHTQVFYRKAHNQYCLLYIFPPVALLFLLFLSSDYSMNLSPSTFFFTFLLLILSISWSSLPSPLFFFLFFTIPCISSSTFSPLRFVTFLLSFLRFSASILTYMSINLLPLFLACRFNSSLDCITLKPIYKGSPSIKCSYCGSVSDPSHKDEPCANCTLSTVRNLVEFQQDLQLSCSLWNFRSSWSVHVLIFYWSSSNIVFLLVIFIIKIQIIHTVWSTPILLLILIGNFIIIENFSAGHWDSWTCNTSSARRKK